MLESSGMLVVKDDAVVTAESAALVPAAHREYHIIYLIQFQYRPQQMEVFWAAWRSGK